MSYKYFMIIVLETTLKRFVIKSFAYRNLCHLYMWTCHDQLKYFLWQKRKKTLFLPDKSREYLYKFCLFNCFICWRDDIAILGNDIMSALLLVKFIKN